MVDGKKIGEKIISLENEEELEKGSIIIIVATDIPLSERQLKRISKRVPVSLARTGSHIGNGSGDIVITFTTANRVNHYEEKDIVNMKMINENKIDTIFRAAIETVEESILSSLLHSTATTGRDGNTRESLNKYIDFEISIGYGIGINLEMAVNNAYTAQRESLLSGKSFVFTENGNLIGPLSSKACMVIENQAIYDIGKIAKNSSLSAITIKKIIAIIKINNSNMITTQDLSLHLKSTVRNANRILKNLEKSGYAKITCTQTTNTKGRPTKVYELNFHI